MKGCKESSNCDIKKPKKQSEEVDRTTTAINDPGHPQPLTTETDATSFHKVIDETFIQKPHRFTLKICAMTVPQKLGPHCERFGGGPLPRHKPNPLRCSSSPHFPSSASGQMLKKPEKKQAAAGETLKTLSCPACTRSLGLWRQPPTMTTKQTGETMTCQVNRGKPQQKAFSIYIKMPRKWLEMKVTKIGKILDPPTIQDSKNTRAPTKKTTGLPPNQLPCAPLHPPPSIVGTRIFCRVGLTFRFGS